MFRVILMKLPFPIYSFLIGEPAKSEPAAIKQVMARYLERGK